MSWDRRVLGQGRHATVFAISSTSSDTTWVALKVVSAPRGGRTLGSQPHDVVKEIRILKTMDHPNIVSLKEYNYDNQLLEHHLLLPLLPLTLGDVLAKRDVLEDEMVQSVTFQSLLGLAHLHSNGIAHRDVKPDNIMIGWDGTIKLIDFGTAWAGGDGDEDEKTDLPWRETSENMCGNVGTGRYRAPELLFSPTSYNAYALDIWALGVVITDCLGPATRMDDDEDGISSRSGSECGFEDPLEDSHRPSTSVMPGRPVHKLFDDTYGDVGLAASIFRILGTPTDDTWPSFVHLPDAGKIEFMTCQPIPLTDLFPAASANLLDLVDRMLRLDPEHRIRPGNALQHHYLRGTLVPSVHQVWYGAKNRTDLSDRCIDMKDGQRLVDLLEPEMGRERAKWGIT